MSSPAEEKDKFDTGKLTGKSVPPVSVVEMGMAFTLFRRSTLNEAVFANDPFEPLSDRYAKASLTKEGFLRGIAILNIHFNHPDTPNAVMRRIASFAQLLRFKLSVHDPGWIRFCENYNRFTPIVHALAWCPLFLKEPFDGGLFVQFACRAPLAVEAFEGHRRCN